MPYRPTKEHRNNINGIIYPLTAAIMRLYGSRNDGAYPIGAFYTINIDSKTWDHAGGIWYIPKNPQKIQNRKIDEDIISYFCISIDSHSQPTHGTVTWELIPHTEAEQLNKL